MKNRPRLFLDIERLLDIGPDEFGVYDGRELAGALVAYGHSLLVPYANGDPAIAECLFAAVTHDALLKTYAEAAAEGGLPCNMVTIHEPGPQGRALVEGHLAASVHETLRLLQRTDMTNLTKDEEFGP